MQTILDAIDAELSAATNPLQQQLLEQLAGYTRLIADEIAGIGPEHVGNDEQSQ